MNINPMDFVKNLQNMQNSMKDVQEKLKNLSATGVSGGDLVKVTIDGNMGITAIDINPLCVDPRDVVMLQDLIIAAFNSAQEKIKSDIQKEVTSSGINPNMFNGGL